MAVLAYILLVPALYAVIINTATTPPDGWTKQDVETREAFDVAPLVYPSAGRYLPSLVQVNGEWRCQPGTAEPLRLTMGDVIDVYGHEVELTRDRGDMVIDFGPDSWSMRQQIYSGIVQDGTHRVFRLSNDQQAERMLRFPGEQWPIEDVSSVVLCSSVGIPSGYRVIPVAGGELPFEVRPTFFLPGSLWCAPWLASYDLALENGVVSGGTAQISATRLGDDLVQITAHNATTLNVEAGYVNGETAFRLPYGALHDADGLIFSSYDWGEIESITLCG